MAEDKAAPLQAPEQQQQDGDPKDQPAPRTYSQEEVDRIADKVRKNAKRDAELKVRREIQSAPPPADKKDPPAPPKKEEAPNRDDFDTHEEWQAANTEFVARKVVRDERKKADEEAQQRTTADKNKQAEQAWGKKIEAAASKLPDFEEVLEDNEQVMEQVYRAPMRLAITESDIGPQIVYHLCKHPEEVKRIAALPGYKQAAAIAKIEDELLAAAKPATNDEDDDTEHQDEDQPGDEKDALDRDPESGQFKPKKDTPKKKDLDEPIEPVGGRGAGARSSEPSDKDTPEEWRRKEYARVKRLREGNLKP